MTSQDNLPAIDPPTFTEQRDESVTTYGQLHSVFSTGDRSMTSQDNLPAIDPPTFTEQRDESVTTSGSLALVFSTGDRSMTSQDNLPAIDSIPDPRVVQAQLVQVYRQADLLRSLLRLAKRKRQAMERERLQQEDNDDEREEAARRRAVCEASVEANTEGM
jgi:hypothetical protein